MNYILRIVSNYTNERTQQSGLLHIILWLRPKYLYHMISPPMKRKSKQIGQSPPLEVRPPWNRKGSPHRGANGGSKKNDITLFPSTSLKSLGLT